MPGGRPAAVVAAAVDDAPAATRSRSRERARERERERRRRLVSACDGSILIASKVYIIVYDDYIIWQKD